MSGKTYMLFSHMCNPGHMTGAEKYLLFLVQELLPYLRVILVVPNDGLLAQEARKLGCEVQVHPYPLIWPLWDPSPDLPALEQHWLGSQELRMLMNLLHMHRPLAVIVGTSVNALPAMAATRLGIPILWMMTEVMRTGPLAPYAVSMIHRYSAWIGGISEATLSVFRSSGLEAKTMMLQPSWRPEELHPKTWSMQRRQLREAHGISPQATLIGYIVSDIAPHKGFDHFVEMAVRLCPVHPQAHFLIIGQVTDLAYYDKVLQVVHGSGYASRFVLIPYHQSIEAVYPAMDVVVVPSLVAEGFGLTAMEGLIFGKPVIAYRNGGLEEILMKTGLGALLVPPGDVAQLTQTVSALISDRQQLRSISEEAQRAVQATFGIEAYRMRLRNMMQTMDVAIEDVERHHANLRGTIPNGALLRGSQTPAVFLIQNGMKRAFASEHAFLSAGFRWQQIQTVDDSVLQWFPNGMQIR
jgi:glycosyltransferase involved in cell wall biosynthesis